MRASKSLLVFAAFIVAGCLEPPAASDTSPADVQLQPTLPTGFKNVCPPRVSSASDLCAGKIFVNFESLQEPFVAIDPNRPNVIAVGVNGGPTAGVVSANRPKPGADAIRLDIFFSEDGGGTWRRSLQPFVGTTGKHNAPVQLAAGGDPAFQFDEKGVLHVSGIATPNVAAEGWEIFYTSTPDLGRTWTKTVVLTNDGNNDRNWLNLGPDGRVFLPWQKPGTSSEVAWSMDGGATWKVQHPNDVAKDCITVSEGMWIEPSLYIACYKGARQGSTAQTRLYAFDPATGKFGAPIVVPVPTSAWPKLVKLPDDSLLIAIDDARERTVKFASSQDRGVTWGNVHDLRAVMKLDDAWNTAGSMWIAADAWGAVHFILVGRIPGSTGPVGAQVDIVYAVVDGKSGALIAEKVLAKERGTPSPSVPPNPAPAWGDHYYGIAFTPDRAFLVWTRDRTIDYTFFEPVFADASSASTPAR